MIIDYRHRIFISGKRLERWGFPPSCRVSMQIDGKSIIVKKDNNGLWSIAQNNTTGKTGSRLVIGKEILEEVGFKAGNTVLFERIGPGKIRISIWGGSK